MEKRKFKRFPTNLYGVIIIDKKSYVGQLKDVSEEGIGYLSMLDFYYEHNGVTPKKKVKLIVEKTFNYDKEINLDCEIKWTNSYSSDSSKPFLGFKVLNPPNTYKKLVNSLE
jgi:hypothetical protein